MSNDGYLLGFDIGSSSIKATLFDSATGTVAASATSPKRELEILAKKQGWAEQDPTVWWEHVVKAAHEIKVRGGADLNDVKAIGISYQMHGLVTVDKNMEVLRPAIIWCDSRAVPYGEKAFAELGEKECLERLLNSPGNFTASKLAWLKENEPDIFKRIHKIMLPGDYIALKLTGKAVTTPSGLSEGILWDYQERGPAQMVLDYFGFSSDILPEVVPTFSVQGELTTEAARELGCAASIPVTYRAGDQPNNALSLSVLNPGEIAATAGTSGVVYGVNDTASYDPASRVNTFVHVNYTNDTPRYGTLLCLSGTGILNSWIKHNAMSVHDTSLDYAEMNRLASTVPVGADGLVVLPYGNGAERTLGNRDIGASFHGLSFNTHTKAHLLRATQEGIVFALQYGLDIMQNLGISVTTVRAGNANMFLSPLFAEAFATISGAHVELYDTDGSQGAARGAGIGAGIYPDVKSAFTSLNVIRTIEPNQSLTSEYKAAYQRWLQTLNKTLA